MHGAAATDNPHLLEAVRRQILLRFQPGLLRDSFVMLHSARAPLPELPPFRRILRHGHLALLLVELTTRSLAELESMDSIEISPAIRLLLLSG